MRGWLTARVVKQSPLMSTSETAETFATWLLNQAAVHQQSIAMLSDRLTGDSPTSALAASEHSFDAAARTKVFRECEAALRNGLSLEELKSRALKETVSRARGGSSSTSVTVNLMERCITEAWAEVVVALGVDR